MGTPIRRNGVENPPHTLSLRICWDVSAMSAQTWSRFRAQRVYMQGRLRCPKKLTRVQSLASRREVQNRDLTCFGIIQRINLGEMPLSKFRATLTESLRGGVVIHLVLLGLPPDVAHH